MMFAEPFGTAKGQKTKPCSVLFLVAWRSFHAIRTQGLHSNAGDEAHLSLITGVIVDVSGIARWLLRDPPKEASMLAERQQLAVLLDAAACVRLACYTLL